MAEHLTHGRVGLLIRLLGLVCLLFTAAGVLSIFAPLPALLPSTNPVTAATRLPKEEALQFREYSELKARRKTPFEFQKLITTEVALRQQEPEPEPAPAPVQQPTPEPVPVPVAKPDIEGLILVGTARGNPRALAVLMDNRTGLVSTYAQGDRIRDSEISQVFADRIVLALGEEKIELPLTDIQGSENLSRQLQGLPPLPGEQVASNPAPSPTTPVIARNKAVLTGVSSGGQANVVTQEVVSTEPDSASDQQPNQDEDAALQQDQTSQGQGDSAADATSGSSTAEADSESEPAQRRSLGVSGHMLSLDQQQQFGLQEAGLLVTAVRKQGSPIQTGDVILAINGQPFTSVGDAQAIIQDAEGDTIDLKIFRGGTASSVSVNLP